MVPMCVHIRLLWMRTSGKFLQYMQNTSIESNNWLKARVMFVPVDFLSDYTPFESNLLAVGITMVNISNFNGKIFNMLENPFYFRSAGL